MADKLLQLIASRDAKVGIIGMGYVGLPLALCFTKAGFRVVGLESDVKKVDSVNAGQSYIKHITSDRIRTAVRSGHLSITSDPAIAAECDAIIICLPTPLGKHFEPDLSYIKDSVDSIVPFLRENQVICLESTTYPGTTTEELKPRIEKTGLVVGRDIFLVFSPEREDPGNGKFSTSSIPKVVGGETNQCLEVGVSLYSSVIEKIVPVSSTKVAEMAKLLENIYRAVNIGLVNELKIVAERMDVDIWEVIEAAKTKPFGFSAFYPGPGLGGHCIPIDPFYLTWKAREYGIHTRFIELAGEINTSMPEYVLSRVSLALNSHKKALNGSKVLVLGLAYKKNIDDMRESPSIELIKELASHGTEVFYSDPFISSFEGTGVDPKPMKSCELSSESLSSFDCVLLSTDHDDFNYRSIFDNSKLIVDTRGRFKESIGIKVFRA